MEIHDIDRVLLLIKEIEEAIVTHGSQAHSLSHVCNIVSSKSKELLNSTDSLSPILRTALVINWKESAMQSRYKRFKELFPEVTDLQHLKKLIESINAFDFCTIYLNIKPNPTKPQANPKYALLKTLTDGFLEYKDLIGASNEMEALRHWATRVNVKDLRNDFIGRRKGVGIGVVENIRLNLGYTVIKPDRHVIGVVQHFLKLDIQPEKYLELSRALGIDARYLDCLLFEYGKLKNISA